jgi:hypothetical protein
MKAFTIGIAFAGGKAVTLLRGSFFRVEELHDDATDDGRIGPEADSMA